MSNPPALLLDLDGTLYTDAGPVPGAVAAIGELRGAAGAGDAPPAMIGDDLWADAAGAQRAGFQGWLVRTGKFREDVLALSGVRPDRILDSIAALVTDGG